MFDTMGAGYGGTGKKFNWDVLKNTSLSKPFLLSGGIEPGDEPALKTFSGEPEAKNLFAIDVNSRFEISAGVKNMELISTFVKNLKT
jgi:phosphoribosylanthranilate isomerase